MIRGIEGEFRPPTAEDFDKYTFRSIEPPLDPKELSLELLVGRQRENLKTLTGGDWSFVLRYRGKEAFVASFIEGNNGEGVELRLMQLQGAKGKPGYRVASGMDRASLIADQINSLVSHPESPYAFLSVPAVPFIKGILDSTEVAISLYERTMDMLGLIPEQGAFVKRLK